MLKELEAGIPSQETAPGAAPEASDLELRERMSGNICRCTAYPQIIAAIKQAREALA
jgi:xanthine dehydrogenase YagT iron-sulfur-binding subunit